MTTTEKPQTAASKGTPPKSIAERRHERAETLNNMAKTWPALFRQPIPLAIGIGAELFATRPASMSHQRLRIALYHHINSLSYQRALAAKGAVRTALDGTTTPVSSEHRRAAAAAVRAILRKPPKKRSQKSKKTAGEAPDKTAIKEVSKPAKKDVSKVADKPVSKKKAATASKATEKPPKSAKSQTTSKASAVARMDRLGGPVLSLRPAAAVAG